MTRRVCAAVFVLVSVAGAGRAGEKEIVERLQKAGGDALLRHELYGEKEFLAVLLQGEGCAGRAFAELCELRRLRELYVNHVNVSDADIRTVGCLTALKVLSLDGPSVTDAGLKELRALRGLVFLSLGKTSVTDAGLKELAAFPDLEELCLFDTAVTDAGLKELAGLGCLKKLDLSGTKVTEEGAARLKKALPRCQVVR